MTAEAPAVAAPSASSPAASAPHWPAFFCAPLGAPDPASASPASYPCSPRGQYNSIEGQSTCKSCPPGTYSDMPFAKECKVRSACCTLPAVQPEPCHRACLRCAALQHADGRAHQ
jgi:hypothetical protein